MARSVSGLFADQGRVDSIYGALRDAGFEPERITIVSPDGAAVSSVEPVKHGLGNWLIDHLRRHGHPQEHAQELHDQVAQGGWLVSVTPRNDEEDGDARNLMVTAGAQQISSVADGKMLTIERVANGL